MVAMALSHAGNNNVGRGTNQGSVAAKAGTDRQSPPDRHHRFTAAHGFFHGFEHGNHGGDEGDVVNGAGEDGRYPHDEQHGFGNATLSEFDEISAQGASNTGFFKAVNNNEQAGEEEDGRPVDRGQNLGGFAVSFFV